MCTELREQSALSVARVEVNYFQRRLPGASIKAAVSLSLPPPRVSPLISNRLSFPLHSLTQYIDMYRRKRTCTCYCTLSHIALALLAASAWPPSPDPITVAAIPRRACRRGPFTNAHDYRGFAGKALGLRASWESPGIVAFRMKQCATGRWSRIGKFDPPRCARYAPCRAAPLYAEPGRVEPRRNFAFDLTITRHVPGRFINAPREPLAIMNGRLRIIAPGEQSDRCARLTPAPKA